jgi:uncharacterized protein
MAATGRRVIIVHGTFGTPAKNWFPWLADAVRGCGAAVVAPSFPTPEGQSLDAWLDVSNAEIGSLGTADVLVGHSLGSGFALRLLERADARISGLFLVSGFVGELQHDELDVLNSSFVQPPFDWPVIRRHAELIKLYNGDDDPFVPLAKGEELATALAATLTVVPSGGHINGAAGFTEFPQLFADLEPLLQ